LISRDFSSKVLNNSRMRSINPHRLLGLLAFRRRRVDCVSHFDPLRDRPKRREFSVEVLSRSNQNKEVGRGAVW
jgi:hypothetical protein